MAGLTPHDHQALRIFTERLHQTFPGRLQSLQLFGSKARGEATKFSDVDVLVIVQNATSKDRHAVSRLTAEVLLETGIVISPKTFSPQQLATLQRERSMFWQSIQPNLVPLG